MLFNKKKIFFPGLIIIATCFQTYAQGKAIVKGKVLDSISTAPMGYTSIAVYSVTEKKLVNGNISGDNGDFKIDVPYCKFRTLKSMEAYKVDFSIIFTIRHIDFKISVITGDISVD